MVDYSKWDKFADDISDEEDGPMRPVVHHVEEGGSVTIGPGGPSIAARPSQVAYAQTNKSPKAVII